jgi:hypothetical protein
MDPSIYVRGLTKVYTNVVFLHLDPNERLRNTPLEKSCSKTSTSTAGVHHSADIPIYEKNCFRLATLHTHGGWYLDTEVLTLKRFDGLRNATTNEWNADDLYESFMSFDKGHPFLLDYMNYLTEKT